METVRYRLMCICGAYWQGMASPIVVRKIQRSFYQEHRRRPGHSKPQIDQERRCVRCGAARLGRPTIVEGRTDAAKV